MKKKKLIWVTNVPSPYRLPIFEELAKTYDLDVFYLQANDVDRGWVIDRTSSYRSFQLPVWRIRIFGRKTEVLRGSARDTLKKYDCIVVGGWDSIAYLQLIRWASKNSKLHLFYESTLSSHRFKKGPIAWLRKKALSSASEVITPGIESTEAVKIATQGKTIVRQSFNPIDVEFFKPTQENKNSAQGHKFLYVGRFIPLKNIDALILAFDKIASEQDTLTIVGYGDEIDNLKSLAAKVKNHKQIFFEPKVEYSNLPALYSRHHTQVLPSKEKEVWGMVVAEALSMGLHSVVSSQCGILASLSEVPGVFGFDPALEGDLQAALMSSKKQWAGTLAGSEIRSLANPTKFVRGIHLC